jgi:hypothetical protein
MSVAIWFMLGCVLFAGGFGGWHWHAWYESHKAKRAARDAAHGVV